MKRIANVGGYRIFEVTRGDARRITRMFPGPWTDAMSRLNGNTDNMDANHMWDIDIEPALRAIERGRQSDYFKRYPYEVESYEEIDDWDKACMLHPLFLITTKKFISTDELAPTGKEGKPMNILFRVPPIDMESAYFTDDGQYWGDDHWEPLPNIIGDEQLANDILNTIYDYIAGAETSLKVIE